ncbi:MAG: ABC transporter substrate-binding protein [Patescibacteria group bacterium]|jgi:peptide/nickel transport system substrate-binding protein
MKKLQVWGWLVSGFIKKHKKIILLGTTLGIVFAIFIIWVLPYIPRPNVARRVALVGQYRSSELPHFITSRIGQGLVSILEDGQPAPALASDWKVSNGGKTFTFYLRDNLYWQDGTKVTADTLIYEFQDVETKIVDEKIIEFTLKSPYTPFPTLLSKPALKSGFVGTGEYILRDIEEKSGYVSHLILEGPKENIIVKFYPNLKMATTAFALGEVDEIVNAYKNPYENNSAWEKSITVTQERNFNQYLGLFLNNSDNLLQDKSFRQALAYATVKPVDSTRVLGPISTVSWAYNPDLKTYDYDPSRAQELLKKSIGDLERAKETTLKLSTTQAFLATAESIKQNWEETLGLSVEIQVINTISPDFQILLATQEIPSDPDQYSLWHSTQSQNFIHFKSPRIDKLLEDGRQEFDQEKRKELYSDFQRFFVEDCPVIFLSYPETYTIKRNSILDPIFGILLQLGRD